MAKGLAKKKLLKRPKTKGRRSTATKVQAQGTAKAVSRAFGNGRAVASVPRGLHPKCWDAFHTAHAALPRAVGPYTVVRTTRMLNTAARVTLVGSFQRLTASASQAYWTNICAVSQQGLGPIASSDSTVFHAVPLPASFSGDSASTTACPAAVSVQVMCNQALGAADGQCAAAVLPARIDLYDSTQTWDDVEAEMISYFRPRLLSAGKLSLRGVQMDSHPLSMAEVSEFLPLFSINTADLGPRNWDGSSPYHPVGWAPLMVYNPRPAELTLLITVEWRVRFDIRNPAVASHSHHGVSSDYAWERHIRRATDALPGVIDIVEKVANTGLSIASAARAVGALA